MPVATITETSERFDLKSLPGAYVVVKRMTYGQKLTRQQMAMKMQMRGNSKRDSTLDIEMMNRLTSLWSFANLIGEHNLTELMPDGSERPLNFANVADAEKIRSDVGEEIDTLIDKLNNFDEDADESEPGTLGN